MVIAIDYDGTISSAPSMFKVIFMLALSLGHTVLIITQRTEEQGEEIKKFVEEVNTDYDVPIVWASGKAKQAAAIEAGHFVDIWIEDNPISIFEPLVYVGQGGGVNAAESEETD